MSDSGAIHEMSRTVGGLEKMIESLKDSVETLNETWGQREHAASEGRKDLHNKFETLRTEFHSVKHTVEQQTRELSEIKPAVQEFRDARIRKEGATKFGAKIWAGMLLFSGFLGWAAHELFLWLKH